MKKTIILTLSILVAVALIQSVSAFELYESHRDNLAYHYDTYSGYGDACISFNRYGCTHNYPDYRYKHLGNYNPDWDSNDDERAAKKAIVRWTDKSYNKRYFVSDGKTSAQAFGGDSEPEVSSTSFRNREAYNVWTDGRDRADYYYRTGVDEDLGYVNWRY